MDKNQFYQTIKKDSFFLLSQTKTKKGVRKGQEKSGIFTNAGVLTFKKGFLERDFILLFALQQVDNQIKYY